MCRWTEKCRTLLKKLRWSNWQFETCHIPTVQILHPIGGRAVGGGRVVGGALLLIVHNVLSYHYLELHYYYIRLIYPLPHYLYYYSALGPIDTVIKNYLNDSQPYTLIWVHSIIIIKCVRFATLYSYLALYYY